jgi:hypothetical protein
MTFFTVHLINHSLITETKFEDQQDANDALSKGVKAALMIAVDELNKVGNATAVEVIVKDKDDIILLRSVVSVSVASLAVHTVIDERHFSPSNDL